MNRKKEHKKLKKIFIKETYISILGIDNYNKICTSINKKGIIKDVDLLDILEYMIINDLHYLFDIRKKENIFFYQPKVLKIKNKWISGKFLPTEEEIKISKNNFFIYNNNKEIEIGRFADKANKFINLEGEIIKCIKYQIIKFPNIPTY